MPDRCTIRPDGRTVMCRTSDPNTNLGIRRTQSGRTIWAKQRNLSHSEGKALQQKTGLPFCDGSGFPYVKGCLLNSNYNKTARQWPGIYVKY